MGRRDQRRVALQRAADGDVRRRQARTVARHAASALHRKQRAKQTAPTRSEAKDPIAHRLWEIEKRAKTSLRLLNACLFF